MVCINRIFTLTILFQAALCCEAFNLNRPEKLPFPNSISPENDLGNRRKFLLDSGLLSVLALAAAPNNANAKSYSVNARNMERMSSGDYSGGSTYDNNPKEESAKKRRAMVGCKNPVAREEAAQVLGAKSLSEKDCNLKVLDGESEFMLQALRNLDCPTCPYGISSEKK